MGWQWFICLFFFPNTERAWAEKLAISQWEHLQWDGSCEGVPCAPAVDGGCGFWTVWHGRRLPKWGKSFRDRERNRSSEDLSGLTWTYLRPTETSSKNSELCWSKAFPSEPLFLKHGIYRADHPQIALFFFGSWKRTLLPPSSCDFLCHGLASNG